MAADVLKKIVRAAAAYKNTKPGLVDHPYFAHTEEDKWKHVTTFLHTRKNVQENNKKK